MQILTQKQIDHMIDSGCKLYKDKDFKFIQLFNLWNKDSPHFDGTKPHIYNRYNKCIFCHRPKDWKQ